MGRNVVDNCCAEVLEKMWQKRTGEKCWGRMLGNCPVHFRIMCEHLGALFPCSILSSGPPLAAA